MNPPESLSYSPLAFDDVDHFSQWGVEMGWDVESSQLSLGRSRIQYDHVALPGLLIGHYQSAGTMRNVFTTPEGAVVFMIGRVKTPFVWCGKQVPPSLLGICHSSQDHWVVLPAGWDCYEFTLTSELIRRTEVFPPAFLARTLRFEDANLPLIEPVTSEFLQRMDVYFDRIRRQNGDPDMTVNTSEFFDFVVDRLQQVIDAGLTVVGARPRTTRRADLIPKSIDVMNAHLATDLTADQLAQLVGVSYRVLNYAFKDAFGVSPYQFFLTEKLHAARRVLKTDRDVSILQVCSSHGYAAPSRFAYHYKRLFGELPSETSSKAGLIHRR